MTRTSGDQIILTPCCGKLLCTPSYGSINLSATENWTDGRSVNSLFSGGGGLRKCECGEVFLLSDACKVGNLTKPKPRAPKGWEKRSVSWWHQFWGFPSLERILQNYDTRSEKEILTEEMAKPAYAKHLDDREVKVHLDKKQKPEVELRLRRRYWQHLNDSYRPKLRAQNTQMPFVFVPTQEQSENMRLLISLIEAKQDREMDDLVELYRELGDFGKAAELLTQLSKDECYEEVIALQSLLIERRDQAPTLIIW